MSYGLDECDDELGLPSRRPGDMDAPELADALERAGVPPRELLEEAAARLRRSARMRDALADRVAEVERLRRLVDRLRRGGGPA